MTVATLGGAARLGAMALLLVCSARATAQGDAESQASGLPAGVAETAPPPDAHGAAPAAESASAPTLETKERPPAEDRPGTRAWRMTPAKWTVQIEAPDDLRELLEKYLDVARFREESVARRRGLIPGLASTVTSTVSTLASAVPRPAERKGSEADGRDGAGAGKVEEPAAVPDQSITTGELRRLVAATPAQARQLLETEGYFSAKVQARLKAGATADDEALVLVTVEPGPQTTVRSVVLRFQGDLDRRADLRDPAAMALVSKLNEGWSLPKGDVFTQAKWSSAKGAVLTAMRAQGYLSSAWSGTSASVEEASNEANLFLIADSGPLYHFGPLSIEGLNRINPSAAENLRGFVEGEPYTDKALFDYQERLQKLGLFSSVAVSVDPDPEHAAAAPVLVRLKEQPMQQSTFGIGYSDNSGARISLEQVSRRVFDWDWQAKTVMELGSKQSSLTADFTSYPLPGMRYNLFSAAIEHLEAAGSTTHSQSAKAGRSREQERIERTFYIEWQRARVLGGDGASTEASAVTGNVKWVRRQLDNVMAPTDGFAMSIETAIGESYATDQTNGPFARLYWRTLAYQPLPGSWFASGRLDLGRVQAKSSVGIPDTLLFRAGGDDSIRGYAYRSIGPTRDGIAVGGRTLTTGSIEMAHPIWANRPAFLWAVFVDAGDAVDNLSDIHLKLGYGVGVRWRSPVGALRLDVAHGEAVHETRMHLSLGIAF